MPKILNGKDFERGYTSTESYKLREKNMPDLNLAKYNNKALNSDEKKMYQNNRTGGLLGIDQKIQVKNGQVESKNANKNSNKNALGCSTESDQMVNCSSDIANNSKIKSFAFNSNLINGE